MNENLKDYRDKELKGYIITCGIILFLLLNDKVNTITLKNFSEVIDMALISVVISSFIYIFDGLIDRNLKYAILFLFMMPGEKVFSELIKNAKDTRIDENIAHKKYKDIYDNLPKDANERRNYENTRWYSIYQNHSKNAMVQGAERDFLLIRDMGVVNVIMLITYIILCLTSLTAFKVEVLFILLILYVTTILGTHSKAKTFCLNVIAYDLSRVE